MAGLQDRIGIAYDESRQEVAREIIQYIEDQGIIGSGWNYHQVYEIDLTELKRRYGLTTHEKVQTGGVRDE